MDKVLNFASVWPLYSDESCLIWFEAVGNLKITSRLRPKPMGAGSGRDKVVSEHELITHTLVQMNNKHLEKI